MLPVIVRRSGRRTVDSTTSIPRSARVNDMRRSSREGSHSEAVSPVMPANGAAFGV